MTYKDKINIQHNYISLYKYKKLKRENELLKQKIKELEEENKMLNEVVNMQYRQILNNTEHWEELWQR